MADTDSIARSWRTNATARESLIEAITRDLSKTGSLAGYEDILGTLAGLLTKDEVVELYKRLQQSRRAEFEWSEEFLQAFATIRIDELPEPTIDEATARRLAEEARMRSLREFGEGGTGVSETPF